MNNEQWKLVFEACARLLGKGEWNIRFSKSWCSWTTFGRLEIDAGYWQAGLPRLEDIGDEGIRDGGVWGQPFPYAEIAHIIIPRTFTNDLDEVLEQGIGLLQQELERLGIRSKLTERVLEIKLY